MICWSDVSFMFMCPKKIENEYDEIKENKDCLGVQNLKCESRFKSY